MDDKYTTG